MSERPYTARERVLLEERDRALRRGWDLQWLCWCLLALVGLGVSDVAARAADLDDGIDPSEVAA